MEKNEKNTEQIILAAAEEEFLEKGLAGARTVSIAARAGVTHAMLHYYFRTKDQLFSRIIRSKIAELIESCISIFSDTSLPIDQRIEKGISAHFDFLVKNPKLPRFVILEISNLSLEMIQDYLPIAYRNMETLKNDLNGIIEPFQLLREIVSLNVLPFLVMPAFDLLPDGIIERDKFFEQVKKENISVIKKRLGL